MGQVQPVKFEKFSTKQWVAIGLLCVFALLFSPFAGLFAFFLDGMLGGKQIEKNLTTFIQFTVFSPGMVIIGLEMYLGERGVNKDLKVGEAVVFAAASIMYWVAVATIITALVVIRNHVVI